MGRGRRARTSPLQRRTNIQHTHAPNAVDNAEVFPWYFIPATVAGKGPGEEGVRVSTPSQPLPRPGRTHPPPTPGLSGPRDRDRGLLLGPSWDPPHKMGVTQRPFYGRCGGSKGGGGGGLHVRALLWAVYVGGFGLLRGPPTLKQKQVGSGKHKRALMKGGGEGGRGRVTLEGWRPGSILSL